MIRKFIIAAAVEQWLDTQPVQEETTARAVASLAVVLLVIYDPNLAQQGDYTLLAFCAMALGSFFGTTYGILYGPLLATVIADAPDETSSAENSPVEVEADDP